MLLDCERHHGWLGLCIYSLVDVKYKVYDRKAVPTATIINTINTKCTNFTLISAIVEQTLFMTNKGYMYNVPYKLIYLLDITSGGASFWAGAELGSHLRGGKGGARFPGPTKLTTGGGVQFDIFPENIYRGKLFQLRGAKLPLCPRLIVKFTNLYYGLSLFSGGKLPTSGGHCPLCPP